MGCVDFCKIGFIFGLGSVGFAVFKMVRGGDSRGNALLGVYLYLSRNAAIAEEFNSLWGCFGGRFLFFSFFFYHRGPLLERSLRVIECFANGKDAWTKVLQYPFNSWPWKSNSGCYAKYFGCHGWRKAKIYLPHEGKHFGEDVF